MMPYRPVAGKVYVSRKGEQRLVVSVGHFGVYWRAPRGTVERMTTLVGWAMWIQNNMPKLGKGQPAVKKKATIYRTRQAVVRQPGYVVDPLTGERIEMDDIPF